MQESVAGRIHNIRDSGKLKFYDLHSEGKRVRLGAAHKKREATRR